jgi:hypothetical protein
MRLSEITERMLLYHIRKGGAVFPECGKLEKYKRPGSRETWIATPECMEQLKLDWKF